MSAASQFNVHNSPVLQEVVLHKHLMIAYFEELARAEGLDESTRIGEEINLLHEGATAVAQVSGDPETACRVKAMAARLIYATLDFGSDKANREMSIRLKRLYEKPAEGDRYRILVARLWPRGISQQEASISLWLKDIAPPTELRKWYGHSTARWEEFRQRFLVELEGKAAQLKIVRELMKCKGRITLV